MFPYVTLAKDKSWQPGPYDGVELLVLHKNEMTGGVTILRKFRAGLTVPAHIHPLANEYAYVLSGEWEESGAVYTTERRQTRPAPRQNRGRQPDRVRRATDGGVARCAPVSAGDSARRSGGQAPESVRHDLPICQPLLPVTFAHGAVLHLLGAQNLLYSPA